MRNRGAKNAWAARLRQLSGKRLGRAAMLTSVLRSFQLAAEFLIGLLLARLLGAASFGAYAFATAWAGLLGTPATLGFDRLLVREAARCSRREGWGLLRGILERASLAVLIAVSALILAGCLLAWLAFSGLDVESRNAFLAGLALVPLLAVARLRQAALQGLNRIGLGQLPESVLQPAALLLLVGLLAQLSPGWRTGPIAVAMQVCAAALACGAGIVFLHKALPAGLMQTPAEYRDDWLREARPFLCILAVNVVMAHADLILVGLFAGPEAAGVYRAAQQLSALAAYPLMAMNVGLAPLIARLYARNKLRLLQGRVTWAARATLIISFPISACLIGFGGTLLGLFGPGFENGRSAMAILTLGQVVNAATGSVGYLLIMTCYERVAAQLFGLGAAIHLLGNLALIPRFGLAGAALATSTSLVLLNLLLALAVHRRLGIDPTAFGLAGARTRA